MATEKQLEANRRNALKSCGPKTCEGKEASRRNALKHGLTAEALALPDEDPAELDARVGAWLRDLAPRNHVEEFMVRRAAVLSWKLDRGDRHEAAVLGRMARQQAEADRAKHREKIGGLMVRLLPTPAEFRQGGFDPAAAGSLVEEVESSAQGCGYLIECWGRLRQAIDGHRPWTDSEEMAIVRLLGQGPATLDDPATLDLVIAGRLLMPDGAGPDPDRWEPGLFPMSFCRDALRAACERRPTTYEEVHRILGAAIDGAVSRLEIVRKLRGRDGDDWGAAESAAVAAFDASNEGERLRRYQTTSHRDMVRTLESVSKLRAQAVKLEKDEHGLARLRNEANRPEVRQECRTQKIGDIDGVPIGGVPTTVEEPAELRNEANPVAGAECPGGTGGIPNSGMPSTYPNPVVLRNEPNSGLYGVEWIDIPGFGADRGSFMPLRAAS